MSTLPMFPLSLVHFPHTFLPLQVFEPRYRALTLDCLQGDREFGVVLIERGSEVGGGDDRFDVGTVTTIVDAGLNELGLIRLDTVGARRTRVVEWLPEDPYPRAEVVDLPDLQIGPSEQEALATAERVVRHALALRAELDEPTVPFNVALDDDPRRAVFQLAAIAPLGPADHQRILATERADDLLRALIELTQEQAAVLAQRLGGS